MTILVPYDGSYPAQQAVERAVEIHGEADLVLLRVIEIADSSIDAGFDLIKEHLTEEPEDVADAISKEVSALLDDEDVSYRTETAVGRPGREIVSYAEENDVSEIIIGSHGREGVSRVLLGSVAETVVRRAPTTVTVVRKRRQ